MIRVVIADDSSLLRRMLVEIFQADGQITVAGQAKNGLEAVDLVKELKPDILILDCEMPVMNGLEALRRIMAEAPLPVFMFSSLTWDGASVTVKALEYGAVDFLLKPARQVMLQEAAQDLLRKIKFIAIRSKFKQLSQHPAAAPVRPPAAKTTPEQRQIDLIVMGSSTGGVQASMQVISRLPAAIPPIVWVQHMPPGFTKSFAQRLNGVAKISVKEAEHGDVVMPGHCYLAAGGVQLQVRKSATQLTLCVEGEEKVSGHCPSCDVLFHSVARYYGRTVLGIILTGMGEDGAEGLRVLHEKGAYVIGQNEESCVVYGMPRAARQAGAVDIEADIADIAHIVTKIGGWQ